MKQYTLLLVVVLVLWLVSLFILDLCASDLFQEPEFMRERCFAASVNMIFALIMISLFVPIRGKLKSYWKKITVIFVAFLGTLVFTGLWAPLVASFLSPPWADKTVKVPFSAATSYMCDVYLKGSVNHISFLFPAFTGFLVR